MAQQSEVVRLSRLRSKVRTDLWPDPPLMPDSMTKRFPELEKWNREMKLFVERIKNAVEPTLD